MNEEPAEEQQPGGWGGWEELPPVQPAQQEAPEEAPTNLEEVELDDDAEAEFAPEGGLTEPLSISYSLIYLTSCPC